MASKHIKTVQGYLREIGWPLKKDGEAGPMTRGQIAVESHLALPKGRQ